MYLWIRVPDGETGEGWAERLLAEGVVVSPGSMYTVTNDYREYIRIAMVPSLEDCRKTIEIWRRLM